MILRNSIGKYLALGLIFSSQILCAQQIVDSNGQPFLADISSLGEIVPIDLSLELGKTHGVALNDSNYKVIGGSSPVSRFSKTQIPFVKVITPIGDVQSLPLSFTKGEITSVALNDQNMGVLGGGSSYNRGYNFSEPPYAAFISSADSSFQLTPLSLGKNFGRINSVAINHANIGIIGGIIIDPGEQSGYAAFVSWSNSSPVITPIQTENEGGEIRSVAIDSANTALIGGISLNDFEDQIPFAAFVSWSGPAPKVIPIPTGNESGSISSVAINNSYVGILGGDKANDTTRSAYAAIASLSGSTVKLTPLSLYIPDGEIKKVSINDFENALIGGIIYGDQGVVAPYVAIIAPIMSNYAVQPIELNIVSGYVNDVALNNQNFGIVVGSASPSDSDQSSPFIVLISPSGNKTITYPKMNVDITRAAINNMGQIVTGGGQNEFSFITQIPTDSLTGNSLTFANYINTYALDLIPIYLTASYFDDTMDAAILSAAPIRNAISTYTASNNLFYVTSTLSSHLHIPKSVNPKNQSVWFSALGATSYQQAQQQTVAFKQASGGAVLGWDKAMGSHAKIGIGASYLFTKIKQGLNAGKGHIDQENLFFYTQIDQGNFYVDGSILTGLFQTRQVRHISTGFEFNASSTPHGYQLQPRVEVGIKLVDLKNATHFSLTPLLALDWANTWQKGYREKGDGPFNITQKAHYSSLLRTEASVRASQTISSSNLKLTFQGKGGFVNTSSFSAGKMDASLFNSTASFTMETLSKERHLGLAQASVTVQPVKPFFPASTVSYQGEFGKGYHSHQMNVEMGWKF